MTFSRVLMVICLLAVINVKPIKTSSLTKCHSLCVCLGSTTVDCSNKNLTSAPNDLPRNTTLLLLNNNQIESLSPVVFYNLPHLTTVNLTGNKIKCDCSLSWVKNASIDLQFVATCQSPSSVRGRSLANLTEQDMCKIPSTTPVATKTFQSTVPTTTAPQLTTTTTAATTTEKAVTSEVITSEVITSEVITSEVPTTTVKPQTTRSTIQTINTDRISTVTETPTTITVSDILPTYQPNATSSTVPTDRQNGTGLVNLTSLVEKSNERELDAESLRNLVHMLESDISTRNYSDSTTTKNFLLISSNLMRNENRKTWSTVNENFPGVERLLKAVNKAMRLQATEMLKPTTNYSQHFFVNYSNLEAEIHVDVGEKMAEKEIRFPSSRLTEEEYIHFPGSSFKQAGKNKVAVVGMKSAPLGELLPRRSLIDDFDNFRTGSGVLSATILSLKKMVTSPVRIKFKNKNFRRDNEEHAKCVFWKHEDIGKNKNSKTSSLSRSGWSDEGCEVVSRNRSTTICHCDHMTDFAVITRSIENTLQQEVVEPKVIMYIAGLCLLIGALIALIRNAVVWRETRRERLSLLIHECIAFILTAGVFLLGLFLDYHQAMCMIFAALLHWFVLAVFSWILAEFVQLYLCINYGWNRSRSRLKYFAILGWVAPLFLVGVTLAVTRQNEYGSTQWCWYSDSQIILLTYVCPIVLCILVSIVVFLKIVSFKCDATDDGEKKDVSVILVLSGFLILLVLFTFTTAALSADRPGKEAFQYVFAVFCVVLALYIVIYHCWLDREIVKLSVRKNVQKPRPKRDYYSTKETVMYSEGTSEGKSFSLIFPSRKSPTKKPNKSEKRPAKRSDSSSPFDYDSTVPMHPSVNDSSLKSFKSQVSTQQHTLDTPPNTLSAITISRPNSQCVELASLSDLDRRPDGAEQTDAAEPSDFYGSRHSNPLDGERQRTSGCSTDLTNASTFGKEKVQKPAYVPNDNDDSKNRNSGASSAGVSRTSRSSVSGASLTAPHVEENGDEEAFEQQPFIRRESDLGPEIRSDPPAKIPKRRKRGSRRRLDDEFQEDDNDEPKIKTRQNSSSLPVTECSVKLKQYTSF